MSFFNTVFERVSRQGATFSGSKNMFLLFKNENLDNIYIGAETRYFPRSSCRPGGLMVTLEYYYE